MSSLKDNSNPIDALSMLVDAANAEYSTSQEGEVENGVAQAAKELKRLAPSRKVPSAVRAQDQRAAEQELREAVQRQALEREALQQRALMGGLGGMLPGAPFQEAEYMQQLRLEALVQQRRQETLAQLAMTQDFGMSHDVQARMLGAQQLRQATMMRDQEMLMGATGFAPSALEQMGMSAALRGREETAGGNQLLRLFEERDRQQKLAAITRTTAVPSHDLDHPVALAAAAAKPSVAAELIRPALKTSELSIGVQDNSLSLAGSKVTVLPCRARGMPMDHNAKTAYFVIPEDMKHGAELVCSYNACRNAGTKFRYCVHCQLPVAKRNFFKRHKHLGKIPPERLVHGIAKVEDELSSLEGSSKRAVRCLLKKADANSLLDKLVEQKSEQLVVAQGAISPDNLTSNMRQKLVESRTDSWISLLGNRPRSRDEKAMLLWVRQVLAVSDLGDSETNVNDPAPTTSVDDNERKSNPEVNNRDELIGKEAPDAKKESEAEIKYDALGGGKMEEDDDASSKNDESEGASVKPEDDGNVSDGSTSSSEGSVDLRAHKKAKT